MKSLRSAAVVLVLCSAFAAAQTTAAPKTPAAPATKPAVSASPKPAEGWKPVPGTGASDAEPVITVESNCPAPKAGAPKSACKQVITAGEFRRMAAAVNPNMTPAAQRTFAMNLARMLAYTNESLRLNLQNSPDGKTLLEIGRMQAMAQMLGRKLREQAEEIPPGAVQTYYRENQSKFETANLERLVIPAKKAEGAEPDKQAELDYATQLRTRWVAGEDPEKLQKEAFDRAGLAATPPPVKVGERTADSLPAAQVKVFELKAGEISEPFYDPSATGIYKLVSKQNKPLDQVSEEITNMVKNQRLEQLVQELDQRTPAKINDTFFSQQPITSPKPIAGPEGTPSREQKMSTVPVPQKEPK